MNPRLHLTALALSLTLLVAPAAHAAAACPTVVPGVSIGPLKLGMSVKQVRKLKLPKDLYEIYYDRDNKKVSSLGLNLRKASCFVLGAKKVGELKQGPFSLALKLGTCGPMEMRIGGNNIYCDGGKISLLWNQGYDSLRVNAAADRPRQRVKTICDAYVGWGELVTKAGKRKTLTVKAGQRYCFGQRIVSSTWTPDTIWAIPARSCGEKKQRGETVLNCDGWGLKFHFKGTLKRIEAYPPGAEPAACGAGCAALLRAIASGDRRLHLRSELRVADDAAVNQLDDALAAFRDAAVVGHDQLGEAEVAVELVQQTEHLRAALAVQVARGLVGQQQRGLHHQRPGHSYPLLLPPGQDVGQVVRSVLQPHLTQQLPGPPELVRARPAGVGGRG